MICTIPSTTLSVSILNSTLTSDPLSLEGHACLSVMMTREGTYGIRRRSIHPSAWNRNSANFAFIEFSEVDIPALCVAPSLCARNSYVEITGSWPCLHKTLSGAGRWNRANFRFTEFSEVRSHL